MKARFSCTTAKAALNTAQREAYDRYIQAEFAKRQDIFVRRILLSMCLALNDIGHFGTKRLMYILKGIEDIATDYAERAYTASEGRKDSALIEDKMADLMQDELLSRPRAAIRIPKKYGGENDEK